jgi:putative intracellular protease/amidase
MKNVLFVLTSHDELGSTGKKTGFWLEEFASPYYAFIDGGLEVTLATPKGGQPPLDPKSSAPEAQTTATKRFNDDPAAQKALAHTKPVRDVHADDFGALFFPGGHGPMWDLASDETVAKLTSRFYSTGKPVGAVCHGPAALTRAVDEKGAPILKGRKVTGFSNTEEETVGLTKIVPFLLEDKMKALGGIYERGPDWASHVVVDGHLVTGQNPASSEDVARKLIGLLAKV